MLDAEGRLSRYGLRQTWINNMNIMDLKPGMTVALQQLHGREEVIEATVVSTTANTVTVDMPKQEREKLTVYVTPAIAKKLRHRAIDEARQISELADDALSALLGEPFAEPQLVFGTTGTGCRLTSPGPKPWLLVGITEADD